MQTDKKTSNECYRILVVEDSPIIRKVLLRILREAGHICDEAEQGHSGLACVRRSKASQAPYDLIITDLMMPEMDGWAFIENLAERGVFPETPVVIITAEATLDSVKQSGKLGIKNYIIKPFEPDRVLETVRKAIIEGRSDENVIFD